MMRSLYSGISGLKNHQTRMDVIANNISNVNTIGYKVSRTVFQDIFSQTARSGSSNREVIGGTNPVQIGLGIQLSSIDVLHTQSAFQRTDNAFDMMVNGDGYFIVQNESGDYFYSRAGNFHLDDEGYLVSSHGYYVMAHDIEYYADTTTGSGGTADPVPIMALRDYGDPSATPPILSDDGQNVAFTGDLKRIRLVGNVPEMEEDPSDPGTMIPTGDYIEEPLLGFAVSKSGEVTVLLNNVRTTIATLALGMFANPGGLDKAGDSLYRESNSSGAVAYTMPVDGSGSGEVMGGGLEMSNVDLSTEFTDMIVTQRGFQANSRVITVSDTLLEELVNLKR